ncbi:MAG: hypothetical protein WC635_00495 [Bacteriovorax sp.]|jgi:hypothetical protein
MALQIKKFHFERRRYLKTSALTDLSEWLFELARLKEFIAHESSFQIVANKVIFEIALNSPNRKMMLEVVGVPMPMERNTLELWDQESCEILVHKMPDVDLFNTDFEDLIKTGHQVHKSLEKSYQFPESGLSAVFHIVFDNEKIELHFFRQKDYIQKQL